MLLSPPPSSGKGWVGGRRSAISPWSAAFLDALNQRGDDGGRTVVDPESLLLSSVHGKHNGAACERLIRQVHERGTRTDLLITADKQAPV